MKNFSRILILLLVLATGKSFAQCVPDASITESGIFPDSATGLPHAYLGVPYSTDIQFRVPLDTVYNGLPAQIVSIAVASVTGLPPGFTYTCTPSNCTFPGNSNGCMLLQCANPTVTGAYPIVVNLTVSGTVFGFPQTIPATNDNYTIYVENNVGIISANSNTFSVGQNLPNPANGLTEIPVTMPVSGLVDLKVSDLIGKVVYSTRVAAQKGMNSIPVNTSAMRKGIYVYTVTTGANSISKRMIIAD